MTVNLSKIRLSRPGNGYNLQFEIRVVNSTMPLFIPVVIHTENKQEKHILPVSAAEQTLSLPLRGKTAKDGCRSRLRPFSQIGAHLREELC